MKSILLTIVGFITIFGIFAHQIGVTLDNQLTVQQEQNEYFEEIEIEIERREYISNIKAYEEMEKKEKNLMVKK